MSRFQILALSGGGYMGLYTASVLKEFEDRTGKPIGRCFDLICGTSIGGVIGLGIAFEKSAASIVKEFETHGLRIFPKSRFGIWRRLKSSAYSEQPLKEVVSSILGADVHMGDALHPIIVPALSVTKGAPQIFKTPHHPTFEVDWKRNAVAIALATSAAPTIFPLAQIDENLFADGGIYANSPDQIGLHEAKIFMNAKEEDIHILSIGTTTQAYSFAGSVNRNLGLLGWGKDFRFLRATMSSQQKLVDFMMRHILDERYLRIDSEQSPEQSLELALDKADKGAQRTLRAMAANSVQAALGDARLEAFLKHNADKPKFFHGPNKNIR